MVDFSKINADRLAAMTPEERARRGARLEREAAIAASEITIDGHFERLGKRPVSRCAVNERQVEREWVKPVRLRIEQCGEGEEGYEVLHILDAVTGHESFKLDHEFVRLLQDPEELARRPRFYVCSGTPGRYDACWISPVEVVGYLKDRRPAMFEAVRSVGPG